MQNSCYEESVKDSPVMMIFLALLAVAGTLGGVWLGRYLERDNEALKWRREHALEAYTEVLRACAVVMDQKMPVSGLTPILSLNSGQLLILKPAAAITSCSLGWNGYPLT
jgi:membrane protein YqaA with SNARE-associated domain